MLLAVDAGNTNIKLGVFREGGGWSKLWRMSTFPSHTSDEVGFFLRSLFGAIGAQTEELTAAVVCSVVPDATHALVRGVQKYFDINPVIVSHKMKTGIKFPCNPAEVGADRIVNLAAAHKKGGAVIIVDYGTATKYDVLSAEGEFLTGITAPGIGICADALFSHAALLGKVDMVLPPSIVAANTAESVQAGILYGRIGEAEYIINRLKKELALENVKVVATGGMAGVIAPGTDIFDEIDPFLTLNGLKVLFDDNH